MYGVDFFTSPIGVLSFIVLVIILISIRQVNEYQRGVMFTFGKFTGVKNPGWRIAIPIFQRLVRVDLRTKVVDVPDQEAITKDNVSIRINAVIYYKITNAAHSIIKVENYYFAISQLAQTTMRNAVGEVTLDDLLRNRDEIASKIKDIVDKASDPWGILVEAVELKDIGLPDNMKRTMAKEAEAEREKRAVIIKATGEVQASNDLAKAAHTLAESPGALHLRTLQSVNDLSSDQSNTTIWMIPNDGFKVVGELAKSLKQ